VEEKKKKKEERAEVEEEQRRNVGRGWGCFGGFSAGGSSFF